jgi:hypothetical protein
MHFRSSTLRVTPSVLKTPVLTLLLAVSLFLLGEGLLRQPSVQSQLPPPSLGSTNIELDFKAPILDTLARTKGLDCVFIGNSSIEFSIRPELFQQAYQAQTGENIHCFNFGIRGIVTSTHASLAAWVAKTYHPHLIIVGTYVTTYNTEHDVVEDIPWLQYHDHFWNLEGWFTDSSVLNQYYLRWHQMMAAEHPYTLNAILLKHYTQHPFAADGYFGPSDKLHTTRRPEIDITQPPNEDEMTRTSERGTFRFKATQVASLERFKTLQVGSTQVLFIESPVHPTFFQFYSGGSAQYEDLRHELMGYVHQQGFTYWTTDLQPVIADDGWYDRNHLNAIGAGIYSTWLGEAVGKAVIANTLNNFAP